MKIILTATVSNLGKIGDIVTVKNGYAKNFLIPNSKAISYTANNAKIFESNKKEFEAANEKELAAANDVKAKIANKDVVVIEKASDDGRLYGSVNSATIANAINDIVKSQVASRVNIILTKPIKEVGIYKIDLDLHADVEINLRLVVARGDSEVNALLKAEKKAEQKVKEKKTDAKKEDKSEDNTEEKAEEATEEKPAKKAKVAKKKEA